MPLNEYTTGHVIGKGTYGEVSLVKHKKDRKQVLSYLAAYIDTRPINIIDYITLTGTATSEGDYYCFILMLQLQLAQFYLLVFSTFIFLFNPFPSHASRNCPL